MYAIRRARGRELEALAALELRSDRRFLDVGLESVVDDDPRDLAEFEAALSEGLLWVADCGGEPVGFALLAIVDGTTHLEELSVEPDHGRRGLGRRLVEHVCEWARARGDAFVTLTTYRDVAWNGPFYRRHGFEALAAGEMGPGLSAVREREREQGLDVAPREVLRRRLAPA